MKPVIDFIGVGAQKSGTSWLFYNLKKLPEFSLLPKKELRYFDRSPKYMSRKSLVEGPFYKRLTNDDWLFSFKTYFLRTLYRENYHGIVWKLKYFFGSVNDRSYLSLFSNLSGLTGEVTPSYSLLEIDDIRKMYRVAPNAKIILLLRNPIHRAWSQYLHERRKIKGYLDKEIKTEEVIHFMKSDKQVLRSNYERMIENYLAVYPKSQILIGFYDAIVEEPLILLESVVDFIGGDSSRVKNYLNVQVKYNVNRKVQMPEEVLIHLKVQNKQQIERLASRYGGYCNCWLEESYGILSGNAVTARAVTHPV